MIALEKVNALKLMEDVYVIKDMVDLIALNSEWLLNYLK